MNRNEWIAADREARRAWVQYRDHDPIPEPLRTAWDAAPGYCSTRLHGDYLQWSLGRFGIRRDLRCHRSLLALLRIVRHPRLPA